MSITRLITQRRTRSQPSLRSRSMSREHRDQLADPSPIHAKSAFEYQGRPTIYEPGEYYRPSRWNLCPSKCQAVRVSTIRKEREPSQVRPPRQDATCQTKAILQPCLKVTRENCLLRLRPTRGQGRQANVQVIHQQRAVSSCHQRPHQPDPLRVKGTHSQDALCPCTWYG